MNQPNYRDQIKIVFFDIDDTLYLKHQDYLPESVQPALRSLKANGILPAIATGRTRCAFPEVLNRVIEEEGIELLVTMNGQYVTHSGDVVQKFPLNQQDLARILDFFQAKGIDYAFITDDKVLVSSLSEQVKNALDPITRNYSLLNDPSIFFIRRSISCWHFMTRAKTS